MCVPSSVDWSRQHDGRMHSYVTRKHRRSHSLDKRRWAVEDRANRWEGGHSCYLWAPTCGETGTPFLSFFESSCIKSTIIAYR